MDQYPYFLTNTVTPRVSLTRWRRTTVMTRWRRNTVLWLVEDETLCYDSLKTNHWVMTPWRRNTVFWLAEDEDEKFRGIDLEWFPLFRGRKWSLRGIPKFTEESIPKLGTERNDMKKIGFTKILLQQTELTACFFPRNASERNSKSLLLFLFHGTEFLVFFSSAEWFGTEFRKFSVSRNSRNSAGTNRLFRLFRLPRNNFLVGNWQP